jgi:hypothetical protein
MQNLSISVYYLEAFAYQNKARWIIEHNLIKNYYETIKCATKKGMMM